MAILHTGSLVSASTVELSGIFGDMDPSQDTGTNRTRGLSTPPYTLLSNISPLTCQKSLRAPGFLVPWGSSVGKVLQSSPRSLRCYSTGSISCPILEQVQGLSVGKDRPNARDAVVSHQCSLDVIGLASEIYVNSKMTRIVVRNLRCFQLDVRASN